jgi:hypothetical protein
MKHSKLFTTPILVLFLLGIIGVSGCDQNSLTGPNATSHSGYTKRSSYKSSAMTNRALKTSAYLTLDTEKQVNLSNLSEKDFETIFKNNLKVIKQAENRLDISLKNGLWQIKQTSGAQVNISKKLYKFVTAGFKNYNHTVREARSLHYAVPLIKSMSEGEGGEGGGGTDGNHCVPYSIANLRGVDAPYDSIAAYQDSIYTSPIPIDDVTTEARHFSSDTLYVAHNVNGLQDGKQFNGICVYHPSANRPNLDHAVNTFKYDSTYNRIIGYDYSSGGPTSVPDSSIMEIISPDSTIQ